MNPALVNGPQGFAPSYDLGGAVELGFGPVYVNGVVMDVGKNDDGNKGFDDTQLGEVYVRFALSELFALTLDVQYQDDWFDAGAGTDTTGWTYGARGVVEF